jgi:hypothetical protein
MRAAPMELLGSNGNHMSKTSRSFTPKKATLCHESISLDTVRTSEANQLRASRPIWGARLLHQTSGGVALEIAVALPDCRGFGASPLS